LEKAAALDPRNGSILINLAYSYMALRNFEAAEKTLNRAITIAPHSFATVGLEAYLAAMSKGDLSLAEEQVSSIPAESDPNGMETWGKWWLLTWQRKFPEALAAVEKFPGETLLIPDSTAPVPKALLEGIIHVLEGNTTRSQTEFNEARSVSEKLLRQAPDDPARNAQHGLILAALGRKEEAIAQGRRAVELLPESQDAFAGPKYTGILAQIYGLTGESDDAFPLIEHLLEVPSGLTIPILKLDPIWDPLRKDPRFQALIHKYGNR
jgi:Flp pilus assembly protein TadD